MDRLPAKRKAAPFLVLFRLVMVAAMAAVAFSLNQGAVAAGAVSWTTVAPGNAYDPDAIPSLYGWVHAKKAIAVGPDGTVYVTGATAPQGNQALTIRYNRSNGAADWRAFATGPSNVFAAGNAIAVDGTSNVYVAGSMPYNEPHFGVAFLVLKYDQAGTEAWRTLGIDGLYAFAEALALDAGGNVYVTGRAYPLGGARADYLTIKYDANGKELWRATLGNAVGVDTTLSLSVDGSGNVYIAATTDATGRNGYLVVSYDANGNERWRVAPKASSTSDDSFAQAAFDPDGDVYLTGTSIESTTHRAFTIAYDRNGIEKWHSLGTNAWESSNGIFVDPNANVYVTGSALGGACGNPSAVAAKYDANGVQQWRVVSDICNQQVVGTSIAVDSDLNVVVAGTVDTGIDADYITIKYSPTGSEVWRTRATGTRTSQDDAFALALDSAGNIAVTGTADKNGNNDWLTIKYDAGGGERWRATEGVAWTDVGFADSPRNGMTVDDQGNVYIAGSVQPVDFHDFWGLFTAKLDPNGAELWRVTTNNATDQTIGDALTLDSDGSVYVVGHHGVNNDIGYVAVKYDTFGAHLWETASHTAAGRTDIPIKVALDGDRDVLVTGYSYDGTGSEYFTVKYDASGAEQWTRTAHGVLPGGYFASDLVVDQGGNAYVSGYGFNPVGNDPDYEDCLTISYAPDGTERWRATCNDAATVRTDHVFLGLDGNGDLYLVGGSANAGTFGLLVIKYSSQGVEQWRTFVTRTDGYPVIVPLDVTVDAAGNTYAVGRTNNNGVSYDYVTVKFDQTGAQAWQRIVPGDSGLPSAGRASITIDDTGNVSIVGNNNTAPYGGYIAAKYDRDGVELWRMLRSNPARSESIGALAVAPTGFYAAGTAWGPTAPPAILIQKIVEAASPSTTSVASSSTPAVAGQAILFTAGVAGSTPAGSVSFLSDSSIIDGCSQVPLVSGSAVCAAAPFPVGIHAIEALYSGDDRNLASRSAILPQPVLRAPTGTTVSSALNPANINQNVKLTAIVTGLSPGGSVNFTDNGFGVSGCYAVPLVSGSASCTAVFITGGVHPIAATYVGDDTNAPSTSSPIVEVVGAPSTTTLTSSPNPSASGQNIVFTAIVTGTTPTGSVDFRDGNATLCPSVVLTSIKNGMAARCGTASLAPGSHSITARYSGNAVNIPSTSSPWTQVVNPPPPGVSLKSSLNPSSPNASVTFTATVSGLTPTGTVTFKDGATTLCSTVLQGGGSAPTAVCTNVFSTRGSHSITAAYSGDANNVGATSPALIQSVKRPKR